MNKKKEFLAIKTWEEYNNRRDEFNILKWDKEVDAHWTKLAKKFSKDNISSSGIEDGWIIEAYMTEEGDSSFSP